MLSVTFAFGSNEQRSHAGPAALNRKLDAQPASAGAVGWLRYFVSAAYPLFVKMADELLTETNPRRCKPSRAVLRPSSSCGLCERSVARIVPIVSSPASSRIQMILL